MACKDFHVSFKIFWTRKLLLQILLENGSFWLQSSYNPLIFTVCFSHLTFVCWLECLERPAHAKFSLPLLSSMFMSSSCILWIFLLFSSSTRCWSIYPMDSPEGIKIHLLALRSTTCFPNFKPFWRGMENYIYLQFSRKQFKLCYMNQAVMKGKHITFFSFPLSWDGESIYQDH